MGIYLNTAAFGLIDAAVKAQADAFYSELASGGSSVAEHWRDTLQPHIRANLARFLGAPVQQVAMIPNFSWGLNGLLQSLDGTERVLLYRGEYPSVTEPFLLNGFAIDWIESPDDFSLPVATILDRIRLKAVDIVVLSHVQYNSGYTLDLQRIGAACREHGVWFVVDATQSLGALPAHLATLPVDVFISSHYKWMNAGFGTGSMYCSAAFLDRYPPKTGGANSYANPGQDWRGDQLIRGYEPGHPNMYGLSLLDAAIRNLQDGGLTKTAEHNLRLTEMLLHGLAGAGLPLVGSETMQDRCSILVFHDREGLSERLHNANITCTVRGGRVRISLHRHNTESDVAACLAAMHGR